VSGIGAASRVRFGAGARSVAADGASVGEERFSSGVAPAPPPRVLVSAGAEAKAEDVDA